MKKTFLPKHVFVLFAGLWICSFFSSCKKDSSAATQETCWSNFPGKTITITFDGQATGYITAYQTSAPDCGEDGYATFNVTVGVHTYTASDGTNNWSGSVAVEEGCNTLLFHP